jgi:lysyl-tRNA synthetase class 2
MTRESYLKSVWNRYPFNPDDYSQCGRLTNFQNVVLDQIEFSIDEKKFTVQAGTQRQEDFRYLCVGDFVALTKDKQIVLLSPFRPAPSEIDFAQQWLWAKYLGHIREFFNHKNFLELNTSILVPGPGPEPSIEVFDTEIKLGSKKKKLFLPTSPELEIKKKLCDLGQQIFKPCVYEITRSFRNDEWTERHRPEFFILEWYQTFASLSDLRKDVVSLVNYLHEKLKSDVDQFPLIQKGSSMGRCPQLIKAPGSVQEQSFKELFRSQLNFDLTPQSSEADLRQLAHQHQLDIHSAESFDDVFFLIYLHLIENSWPPQNLFFVFQYPPSQAALARLDHEGWGDRFEFYWQGLEIANAFCELNDPAIQEKRFHEDIAQKKRLGKKEIPFDHEFIQRLESGFPPTSGIALGLERLFMALFGIKNFEGLRLAHIRQGKDFG